MACQNAQPRPSERPTPVGSCEAPFHSLYRRILTSAVARIDAIQAEYSPFETIHEGDGLIDTARELDVAFIAYGPLGHGWLVEDFPFNTPDDFAEDDYRRESELPLLSPFSLHLPFLFACSGFDLLTHVSKLVPKFQGENFYANKAISQGFKDLAKRKGCTVAQVALAWVASQGIIAIPGTTKPSRLEENWASRDIELTEEDLKEMRATINRLRPQGERYNAEAAVNIGN